MTLMMGADIFVNERMTSPRLIAVTNWFDSKEYFRIIPMNSSPTCQIIYSNLNSWSRLSSDKVASKIGGSILVLLGFSPSKLFKKKNASKHKNSEAQTAVHIPVVQNNLVKNQPKKIDSLEKEFVTQFWELHGLGIAWVVKKLKNWKFLSHDKLRISWQSGNRLWQNK